MPFGFDRDYELNPHFLNGGAMTALPDTYKWDLNDCTGAQHPGGDVYQGKTGIWITAKRLPTGQFHRFRVKSDTDPKRVCINFTSERTSLTGCLDFSDPRFYPERPFNQGDVDRIFVYPGNVNLGGGHIKPACSSQDIYRPIRGCPTAYGWHLEVDSGGTGNFDMTVYFLEGP